MKFEIDEEASRIYMQPEGEHNLENVQRFQAFIDENSDAVDLTFWTLDVPEDFEDPVGSDAERVLVVSLEEGAISA